MSDTSQPQRRIPSIDNCLRSSTAQSLINEVGRELTLEAYRSVCASLRVTLHQETRPLAEPIGERLDKLALQWVGELMSPSLKPVLNLTGTVLHTNLGRAPMPEECLSAMMAVAQGASNLEFDLEKGVRGDRDNHVERWLCRLTGAEAATVVNNNAAAVLVCLNSLALRRSVAVSRGELVEIGGSFRMPDIMKRAGCKLYEVGTTNRTHLQDYADAIDDGATCVMRVHPSNFKVEGFTAEADDKSLGRLAQQTGVRFINDLGAGALVDMTQFGLPAEATPRKALEDGAHVVTFSGDKLLGGPQCGLIVGDLASIKKIRQNPLKRALRCDKVTLAALESILRLYANPESLAARIPAYRLLTRNTNELKSLAQRVQPIVSNRLSPEVCVSVQPCYSQIGSGALPVDLLASWALVIEANHARNNSLHTGKTRQRRSSTRQLHRLAQQFRELPVPVIGRIHNEALWFDLRCLEDEQAFIDNLQPLNAQQTLQ